MSWPGVKGAKNFDDHLLSEDFESDGADQVVWDDKRLFYFCRGNGGCVPFFVVDLNLQRESCDCSEKIIGRPESYEALTPRQRHCYLGWLKAEHRFNPLPEEQYLLIHLAGLENRVLRENASIEDLIFVFDFLCHCHYACLQFPGSTGRFRVSSFRLLSELGFRLRRPISEKFAFVLCCELRKLHRNKKFSSITSLKAEFSCDWKRFATSRNCRLKSPSERVFSTDKEFLTSAEWCESLLESTIHPILRELKVNHKSREEVLKNETIKVEPLPAEPKKQKKKRHKRPALSSKSLRVSSPNPLQLGNFGFSLIQVANDSDSTLSQMVQESRKKME